VPPPETATYATDPRIEAVQAQLDLVEVAIPGFKAMHPMGARLGRSASASRGTTSGA
jgi:cytochrome c5